MAKGFYLLFRANNKDNVEVVFDEYINAVDQQVGCADDYAVGFCVCAGLWCLHFCYDPAFVLFYTKELISYRGVVFQLSSAGKLILNKISGLVLVISHDGFVCFFNNQLTPHILLPIGAKVTHVKECFEVYIASSGGFSTEFKEPQGVFDWVASPIQVPDFEGTLYVGEPTRLGFLPNEALIDHLSAVAEYMPGNFYWKNLEGSYLGCNKALVLAANLSDASDLVGKTDYDLWGPQAKSLRDNDNYVIETGRLLSLEESITLPDGSQKYFSVIKVPLRDAGGSIVGVIGNSLDITETKNLQYELAVAQKKSLQASRSKSDFLSVINELIREPLFSVLGVLEFMIAKPESVSPDSLGFAKEAALRVVPILDRIPRFLAFESGDVELRYEVSNFKDSVLEVLSMYDQENQQRGNTVRFDYSSDLPERFEGPFVLLRDVFDTLISNATRFTRKGDIVVACGLRAIRGSEFKVEFSVSDSGVGIPKESQVSIFSLFSNPVSGLAQGFNTHAGLRLAIVKKIIDLVHGDISVSSEVGVGSHFVITFPLKEVAAEPLSGHSGAEALSLTDESFHELPREFKGNERSLLIVEDSLLSMKVMKMLLSLVSEAFSLSFSCDFATSFSEARQFLSENYDLVLVDIRLPDGSGLDLMKRLRKLHGQEVPIVATTCVSSDQQYEMFMDLGMTAVLEKPILLDKLLEIVKAYLVSD